MSGLKNRFPAALRAFKDGVGEVKRVLTESVNVIKKETQLYSAAVELPGLNLSNTYSIWYLHVDTRRSIRICITRCIASDSKGKFSYTLTHAEEIHYRRYQNSCSLIFLGGIVNFTVPASSDWV